MEILNENDVNVMLDDMLREPKEFWNGFYEDRTKNIPFFQMTGPDENLVSIFQKGISIERVLELGCGPGRNAIYMAKNGSKVDALDISENAIEWAKERALGEKVSIQFLCKSLFDIHLEAEIYDFIYDCGMFHHLAPHRRVTYLTIVKNALKPNGHFGLVCFNTKGAVATSDYDVYKGRSLNKGIGYTEERLKTILNSHFEIQEFREMEKQPPQSSMFGEDFLWTSLMKKRGDDFSAS
ncbi:class I SAM-dependent methyltransferase [Sutcliffiella rhizosphaerae]|uniref:tRNA 5-carboxymethoxyuridine methyltransferase n=1 Tax=Sutcliffiella rhizosphaerae TaxID=2880967 RepID=A0ABN8AEA4_9BACI|nr:class I SAM-dependent methyltransferase [Sutcliffiella rhizosphaerae]CAG9621130.1 tRNA 5-carboxymethoxyuridine methyltransferase [Sutcliffiella rhizosphaerae]